MPGSTARSARVLQKSQGAMKLFAALDLPSPWKRQGWCLYRCLPAPAAKVAGFDFDKTLHFGGTAWKLSSVHIPEKLKRLQQDGYTVVIFSNQHGPGRQRTLEGMRKEVEDIVRRFEDFRAFCGMELHMFVAVARGDIDDPFRKPNTGMWDLMSSLCSSPKVRHSFYVGNSAGRLGDDSAVDRGFAKRLGMTFYSEDTTAVPPPEGAAPDAGIPSLALASSILSIAGCCGFWIIYCAVSTYRKGKQIMPSDSYEADFVGVAVPAEASKDVPGHSEVRGSHLADAAEVDDAKAKRRVRPANAQFSGQVLAGRPHCSAQPSSRSEADDAGRLSPRSERGGQTDDHADAGEAAQAETVRQSGAELAEG
ncbi:unnamed protein product [Effrenium voratum]|nr:unnamed protein product [Effrenium voratum]